MPNYYEILGIPKTANAQEVKNAYRKLAKIYHPDKNQDNKNTEDKFKLIKDAYEVLIDPIKKSKYDATLNYQEQIKLNTYSAKKNYRKNSRDISDEELKRRQYFKQHYPNFNQKKQNIKANEEKKKYNETRAIIFSIPIALALLFFIVNIYNRTTGSQLVKEQVTNKLIVIKQKDTSQPIYNNGAEPYAEFLGKPNIDKTTLDVIKVINDSGKDAIAFIVDSSNNIVRHYYIKNDIELFFEFLPIGNYKLKLLLGSSFKCKLNKQLPIFCYDSQFLENKEKSISINNAKLDTLLYLIDSKTIVTSYTKVDSSTFFNFNKDVLDYLKQH